MLQAIREVYTVEQEEIRVHLPPAFWGQEVEIIVLPMPIQRTPLHQKKSLRGCLQQYANPALITHEQEAWQDAMIEKHAPC